MTSSSSEKPDPRPWLERYVSNPAEGGSSAGTHFYKEWVSCKRKWYWKYRAPHPLGEGLRPQFDAPALMIGSATHDGLEAYYYDYARTCGAPSLQVALDAALKTMEKQRGRFTSTDLYNDGLTEVATLLTDYAEWYGPGGKDPEASELEIYEDAVGPVIEREYRIPLDSSSGVPDFTCRVDAMVKYKGHLYVMEHKTASAYGVRNIIQNLQTQAQGTSECLVLQRMFPNDQIDGILANILVKKRSAKSKYPPFLRDSIRRTKTQLDRHFTQLRNYARALAGHTHALDHALVLHPDGGPGVDPMNLFSADGMFNGHCQAYNRQCEYWELCQNAGDETALVAGYRPARRFVEDEETGAVPTDIDGTPLY